MAEKLKSFAADKALETRPYFAIALASFMTQLGQYSAAAVILDGWLDQQRSREGANIDPVNTWFEIRTRSILAAYFEEWLLKQGASVATALRNEHLDNLGKLRTLLGEVLVKSGFLPKTISRSDKATPFEMPRACDAGEAVPNRIFWRQIFSSYISIELTHAQNQLRHPDYKSKYLELTNTDVVRLTRLDLACLSRYPPPAQVYAQILDTYALNTVQYVRARKDTLRSDDRDKLLDRAKRAITYGLEITLEPAQRDLNRTNVAFLERVSPSDWVTARESLQQTDLELRSLTDE